MLKGALSGICSGREKLRVGPENSLALLQRSFRPFGPQVAKRFRNEFPELGPGGPKKSKTELKASQTFPLCSAGPKRGCLNVGA